MLWFYTRDRDSLRLETRYDNQTLEYVGILKFPNGQGAPQILPDGWPDKPSRWRLLLRQHLMSELRRTRWITFTRTTRSLHPGEHGRGWLRTAHPGPVVPGNTPSVTTPG